jgi:serine protease AprX
VEMNTPSQTTSAGVRISFIQRGVRVVTSALLLVGTLSVPLSAAAATNTNNYSKVAPDLSGATSTGVVDPTTPWAVNTSGVVQVLVLIVADGVDPDMADLRKAVVAAGGTVFSRYSSVAMISALLPLAQVSVIAARADVSSVSPNRPTARTASLIETLTGTLGTAASNPRVVSGSKVTGLDGTGVGIAILDSGISQSHAAMQNAAGNQTRVSRGVDVLHRTA